MAYMNLMYREQANIQSGDPRAYAANIRKADKWVDLTMAAKRSRAATRSSEKVTSEFPNQPSQ